MKEDLYDRITELTRAIETETTENLDLENVISVLDKALYAFKLRAENAENKIEELENCKDYHWCKHTVKLKDDTDLPVPRIEMRITVKKIGVEYRQILILHNFFKGLLVIPLGYTTSSSTSDFECLPYRDGAHMYHHMAQLNVPGFLTRILKDKSIKVVRKLDFNDNDCRPQTKKLVFG